MRRVFLVSMLSFMGSASGVLFAPSVREYIEKLEDQLDKAPPAYNTLHNTEEQTPPTARPAKPNIEPDSPDHVVHVVFPNQPYDPESTQRSCKKIFALTDTEQSKALDAAFELGKCYKLADATMRKHMDGTLRELVLQGLQSENTGRVLQQSFPFLVHYIETQNDTRPLRKALRGSLSRELRCIRSIYQTIRRPLDETLRDGEAQILTDTENLSIQCGKKILRALERERRKKLRKESKRIFVAERPHLNHGYLLQKDKPSLLAALYKHLPWHQRLALWRNLKKARADKEKARKKYYGGLIHMFQ